MPIRKKSRKELLKEPEVVRTLQERALQWVQANQKVATVAATVILVGLALVIGLRKYNSYKETQATALYGQAQKALPEGAADAEAKEKALAAFKAVSDKYPNTRAACFARLERANLLYEAGKPQEAARLYEDCLKRIPRGDDLQVLARQGLAYCRLAAGDLDGARKLFEELASEDFAPGTAQLNLGLIYERQGKPAEALAAYELAAEQASGSEAALARARRAALRPQGSEGGA